MENPPETVPEMPEGVETPELIRFAQWVWSHMVGEGQVIRRAPVAVFVLAAIFTYGLHWLDNKSHSDEIATLHNIIDTKDATIGKEGEDEKAQATTISALQNTIAQLQEELKGTSPQLAAIQAGRDKNRSALQSFYIDSSALLNRQLKTSDDVDKLETDTNLLVNHAAEWIDKNMGLAAKERFLDPGHVINLVSAHAINQKQNTLINAILNLRQNLSILIETAAWDGSAPKN